MSDRLADSLAAAFTQHQAGNFAQAEQAYRRILQTSPRQASAWHLLGALCLQQGRAAEAVELINRAIAIDASQSDFFNHLGAAYGALEQHDAAVASLRRAVQLAPQSAGNHYNLGTALLNQKSLGEAVASFRCAVAAKGDWPEAHYNLANALRELGQYAEAEVHYREAIRIRPGYLKAMINLGNALRDQERFDEAVAELRAAVALAPSHANAHMNLGTALRDAARYDDAVACLRKAVDLDPTMAEAHNNLGTALQAQARFDEAWACYQQSLRLDPNLPDAHFSCGTYLLRQGNLAEGFAEYEWRWRCKSFSTRKFAEPLWRGDPLAGRTILLHAEQGLGDTLHFIRYAADVKARGGVVVAECHPPLVKLLSNCAGIDRLVPIGTPPACDVRCPMMSLPGVLGLSIDELARGAYLAADPPLVAGWRERLAAYRGFRVGICWQGNPRHLFDRQRSFPLELFRGVAACPGVRLVSLQKGAVAEQIVHASFEVINLGPQLDEEAGPFMDTAAIMKNLDLVMTCDTAIAHLAGGLGVPVWVALSANADWRWFTDRDDSPWYPTMRLFRQRQLDDWLDVFAHVAAALAEALART